MPYQIMYSSKATRPLSAADLEQILVDAREGNAARGITGALVYADGIFLQILEGEEPVVRETMQSIARDSRHERVKVFHEREADAPAFGSWKMAYLSPSAEDMAQWAGLEGAGTIGALLEHVHRDANHVPAILVSIVEALAESGRGSPR